MRNGAIVGTVTSGAFGHRCGLNLALAYIDAPLTEIGTALTLDLIGFETPATVIERTVFDPKGTRFRA